MARRGVVGVIATDGFDCHASGNVVEEIGKMIHAYVGQQRILFPGVQCHLTPTWRLRFVNILALKRNRGGGEVPRFRFFSLRTR